MAILGRDGPHAVMIESFALFAALIVNLNRIPNG